MSDPYGTVVWPVTPHPTPTGDQRYGTYRPYYDGGHRGSDYGVSTGTPVVAISNGVITVSARNTTEGNHVDVRHDNGLTTHNIHLSRRDVSVGQRVSAGQQLGLSGNDGTFSQGPHLHIEVFLSGGRIDPHAFFLQYVGPGNDNQGDIELTPEQDSRLKNIEYLLAVENGGGIKAIAAKARDNAQAALEVAKNVESILAVEAGGGIRAIVRAIQTKVGA